MLRPATPLSILLLISFVLLLLSVLSTPIIKSIHLARHDGVNFGVFGWCKDSGECSKITVGWNIDGIWPESGVNLPAGARHSLSSLLIVHPVAALFNLIVLGMAIAAHLHSPSHSARYLLGVLILLLPTLLITLLAFLVDILLFVPQLQWGGWIVLASTILITASGVVTCAMRRTLVSRKARKKRIAENAEMSGENFYNRQAQEEFKMVTAPSTESKAPLVNGAPGSDSLPAFTTYAGSRTCDDRTLDSSYNAPVSATSPVEGGRYYGHPESRSNSRPRREDFSAPLGATTGYEAQPPIPLPQRGGYGPTRGRGQFMPRGGMPSRNSYGSSGLPPPPGAYGRGGYGPRGRGGLPYDPHGPRSPGGSQRPPNYPPQELDSMSGGYGPPRSTSASRMSARHSRPGDFEYERSGPFDRGSSVPPMAYGAATAYGARAQSPNQGRASPYGARTQSPGNGRASPYGSRAMSPSGGYVPPGFPSDVPPIPSQYIQDSRQQAPTGFETGVLGVPDTQRIHPQGQSRMSPTQEYVPARAGWTDGQPSSPESPTQRKRVDSLSSHYVEDVDPKFAEQPMPSAPPAEHFDRLEIPAVLTAGRNTGNVSPISDRPHIDQSNSFEDLSGGRSPVESEVSNFTSVSQRPMNPNWQPGHGGEFNNLGPGNQRYQQQRKQDVLFSNNPDFELPGMGPTRGRGNGYGSRGRGGPMSRSGPMRPPPPSVLEGMGSDGRYPIPMGPSGGGVMKEI